jgi:myosin heavy subunit
MALRDELPESTRQDPARPSSLERVCTALIDRDEALWQARSDLEKMSTLATNWEAEVASVRSENRGLRSSLEGAQAQQRQAEERARALEQRVKEADDLKAALDAKVAALVVAEDQLLQERTARQGAEGRLQQEQAAFVDARSALERERAAREATQMSLEDRNAKFSKVEGELMVLSITSAGQELALQEQGETIRGLEWMVEAERRALEVERKQVEGESLFDSCIVGFSLEDSHSFSDFFLFWQLQACAPRWGARLSRPRRCRPPTTPPSRSCRSCVMRPSRPADPWRRARRRPEARWPAACAPLVAMSLNGCAGRFVLASRRPSA